MAFRWSLGGKGLLSTTIFKDPWGGLFIGSEEEGWLSFNSSDQVFTKQKHLLPQEKVLCLEIENNSFFLVYFL